MHGHGKVEKQAAKLVSGYNFPNFKHGLELYSMPKLGKL